MMNDYGVVEGDKHLFVKRISADTHTLTYKKGDIIYLDITGRPDSIRDLYDQIKAELDLVETNDRTT